MKHPLHIGIFGDFRLGNLTHLATNRALEHAAGMSSHVLESQWLPTRLLESADLDTVLTVYDGFWGAPGSPYESMEGALQAIRWARERDRPFRDCPKTG